MASYTATTTKHATAAANTADDITLTGNKRQVRVQHRTTTGPGIWWAWGYTLASCPDPLTDGSVDGSYYLPPGACDFIREPLSRDNETQIVVKIKTTGTPDYSIEGV